jgi:type IV pilus assembly protein PilQ
MRRAYLRKSAISGLILGVLCAVAGLAVAAAPRATLKGVSLTAPPAGEGVLLRIEGDYSFRAVQATNNAIFVDLMGVAAGEVAPEGAWSQGTLKGYSLLQYSNAAQLPVVHVQLELSKFSPFKTERTADGLQLVFGESSEPVAKAPAAIEAVIADKAPSSGPVEVRGVTIQEGEQGKTIVNIATSAEASYRVFELTNPSRLVVDFEGTHHSAGVRTYRADSPLLSDVRVAQFHAKDPAVVRVVADLAGNVQYEVQKSDSGVRIELKARDADPAAVQETPNATDVAQNQDAAQTPTANADATLPAAEALPVETTLPASAPAAAAPKPEVAAVESPSAPASVDAARVMAGSTPAAPDAQDQGEAMGAPAMEEGPKYTGEPISLNLKNVDLKDFFRLVHEISGLNIIVDPNVSGNVTMVLDSVPWDQALDIVLKNNQLGKTLEGNVLRIARLQTLTAEQANAIKLVEAREEAQPLVTKFVPVNYAKAASIATMLKSWVGGGALSKRGNILVDDRTNTLIVSDIASQIPVILPIITKLDTKTKQVAIEARIERVTRDFSRTLANALSVGHVNASGRTVQSGLSGSNSNQSASTSLESAPVTTVTSTTAAGFGVYAISNIGARYIINDVLAAAENTSDAKTISKPTIVTQNNIPGSVLQGVQIPIQTTINNTISIQYVQASLQLEVTPQVTSDGNIFLVINVQNSSPGAVLTNAGPSINTQKATTQVLVPDGGTVVFGGVTINQTTNAASYVPLLGKIPLLGNLFKSSNKTTNDQELLFFVSPKVLPG